MRSLLFLLPFLTAGAPTPGDRVVYRQPCLDGLSSFGVQYRTWAEIPNDQRRDVAEQIGLLGEQVNEETKQEGFESVVSLKVEKLLEIAAMDRRTAYSRIAFIGDSVVGYFIAHADSRIGAARIRQMAVHRSLRHGIVSLNLSLPAFRRMKERGERYAQLCVITQNERALSTYERLGFGTESMDRNEALGFYVFWMRGEIANVLERLE